MDPISGYRKEHCQELNSLSLSSYLFWFVPHLVQLDVQFVLLLCARSYALVALMPLLMIQSEYFGPLQQRSELVLYLIHVELAFHLLHQGYWMSTLAWCISCEMLMFFAEWSHLFQLRNPKDAHFLNAFGRLLIMRFRLVLTLTFFHLNFYLLMIAVPVSKKIPSHFLMLN